MTETQPITLSPQEYDALVSALAQRDPIIAGLIAKQREAQAAVMTSTPEPPKDTPQ